MMLRRAKRETRNRVRNYSDWIITFPVRTKEETTTSESRGDPLRGITIGYKKIKETHSRVLPFCAHDEAQRSPLCCVGPPFVAKRASQISGARHRPQFVRLGAGAVRDEAGFAATAKRVSSARCPEYLIQFAAHVGTNNPCFFSTSRQDVDGLPRESGGGASRSARPRAKSQLQRITSRSRLRPVRT